EFTLLHAIDRMVGNTKTRSALAQHGRVDKGHDINADHFISKQMQHGRQVEIMAANVEYPPTGGTKLLNASQRSQVTLLVFGEVGYIERIAVNIDGCFHIRESRLYGNRPLCRRQTCVHEPIRVSARAPTPTVRECFSITSAASTPPAAAARLYVRDLTASA